MSKSRELSQLANIVQVSPDGTTNLTPTSDGIIDALGYTPQDSSTAITSSNISTQSVSYASDAGSASSAGNADTLDGNHASAFQAALVSGTNIKTVGGNSLLGSGDVAVSGFPAGTAMLFAQTSAPTGWTKSITHDNKALRVVSGTAGSGGSTAFTSVFASRTPSGSVSSISGTVGETTLSTAQMPSHLHMQQWIRYNMVSGGIQYSVPGADDTGTADNCRYFPGSDFNTGYTGGNGSHTHSFSGSGSLSMSAMDFAVQYVDVIIATKD